MYITVGIAATDIDGNITKENDYGELIPIMKDIDNQDDEMVDYYYLRSVMVDCLTQFDAVIGVIGSNTYEQMKNMDLVKSLDSVIVSDKETINLKTKVLAEIYNLESQMITEMLENGQKIRSKKYSNICVLVLGGETVYEKFFEEYDVFHHLQYNEPIKGGKKSITMLIDGLQKKLYIKREGMKINNFKIKTYHKDYE